MFKTNPARCDNRQNRLSKYEFNIFFNHIALPILRTNKVCKTKEYIQHGNTSCYSHSAAVAYYSFMLVNMFKIKCNKESLIKGALLHDYFLYDWHEKNASHKLHGFKHPKIALANASIDFELDHIEKDIIFKHMFPLTPIPPRYKESAIICLIDKICSFAEVFYLNTYPSFSFADDKVATC